MDTIACVIRLSCFTFLAEVVYLMLCLIIPATHFLLLGNGVKRLFVENSLDEERVRLAFKMGT